MPFTLKDSATDCTAHLYPGALTLFSLVGGRQFLLTVAFGTNTEVVSLHDFQQRTRIIGSLSLPATSNEIATTYTILGSSDGAYTSSGNASLLI